MDTTISVFGRFHAFYLARELERRGHLRRVITSYPKVAVGRWGVSRRLVRSLWPLEAGVRLGKGLSASVRDGLDLEHRFHGWFERLAARRIPAGTDIFVGWSNTAEAGIKRAREMGAVTIVERCSSHIVTQGEILREEYERHGVEPVLPSREFVAKETREYRAADYIAVPSSFVEGSFVGRGIPRERLLRIPYGVDPAEFKPVEKEDDVFRVVFAGQLGHRKGVPYLFRAWRELSLPDAELLLLGPVRPEFRPWMEENVDLYRHPGTLPQSELYQWYSQGSVFVLPSVEEGMAYVQLQAMACGLPLICTPHSGGEDLIREGKEGFVVPIRSVEGLQERLLWCYENPNVLREMGRTARRRVLENFTWRDYGDRVLQAYSNVLARNA